MSYRREEKAENCEEAKMVSKLVPSPACSHCDAWRKSETHESTEDRSSNTRKIHDNVVSVSCVERSRGVDSLLTENKRKVSSRDRE